LELDGGETGRCNSGSGNVNLTHLHLLLNHVPTVGSAVAIVLFAVAVYRKDDPLTRISLGMLVVIALAAVVVYQTGMAARDAIEPLPGVSKALIDAHEDAALPAFIVIELTGAVAWLGLWQCRRFSRPTRGNLWTVAALSLLTFASVARTANLGGEVRHPEIVAQAGAEPAASVQAGWISVESIKRYIRKESWVWPACESVHFIGLSLSFGVVLLLNLRMLGMMKAIPFAVLHRLLPWGILGYGINLATGMVFFIAASHQYTGNIAFQWKTALIMLAGVNLLYFTLFDDPWEVGGGEDASLRTKVMAASAIGLWVGVLYFGRMLPYLGNSF
jgi:hypothetical protein